MQVYDLFGKLKNRKASGIVLKLATPHISTSLAAVFDKCILHRIFPDDLKTGKVVSIFKGDESFAINCLIILTITIFYVMSNGDLDRSFPLYLLCRKIQTVGC